MSWNWWPVGSARARLNKQSVELSRKTSDVNFLYMPLHMHKPVNAHAACVYAHITYTYIYKSTPNPQTNMQPPQLPNKIIRSAQPYCGLFYLLSVVRSICLVIGLELNSPEAKYTHLLMKGTGGGGPTWGRYVAWGPPALRSQRLFPFTSCISSSNIADMPLPTHKHVHVTHGHPLVKHTPTHCE